MKKINLKIIAVAIATLFFGLLRVGNVSAVGRAIAISPTSQRVVLTPGETYRGGMTVSNPNSATADLHYLVTVAPFYPARAEGSTDDYSGVDYTTKTNMNMIVDWLTVDNPTGTLAPNEEVTVSFSIQVPLDAPAGGQYAALLIRENPDVKTEEDDSMSVTEIMQMSHAIYADVAGETIEEGEILQNDIPSFLFNNTLQATSLVRNNGNVHVDAKYILQVWPMGSDEEICTNEESAGTGFIMPNTERYHTETCVLPPFGIFRAKQTVKIFGEVSELEKTIIVCPLWALFLILFAIVALIIWIILKAKTRKTKK